MILNKGLLDFIGYMSFFNTADTNRAADSSVQKDDTEEEERDALSEEPDADDWDEI